MFTAFKYILLFALLLCFVFAGDCAPTTTMSYLRLELAKDATNKENMVVHFSNTATNNFDYNVDAAYMRGFGKVSLCSFSSDSLQLAINTLPFPKKNIAIRLMVDVTQSGTYKLYLKDIANVPALFDILLIDALKKDSVDLRNFKRYGFDVNKADSSTFGSNRFSLLIRQNHLYAFTIISFGAKKLSDSVKTAKRVELTWQTTNEKNYTTFILERSIDNGKAFTAQDSVRSSGAGSYIQLDSLPGMTANIYLYRLKIRDISDSVTYSNLASVSYADTTIKIVRNDVNVYPNPARNMISLHLKNAHSAAARYRISISNCSGLLVKQIASADKTWQGNVSDLRPGIYIIQVSDNTTRALVGYAKFLKM